MFEGLLQPAHLILILIIVLILFGPGKLPEIGSAIGRSIREFRHSVREEVGDANQQAHVTVTEQSQDAQVR
ncbi:twin-arginine translocase TatA/TatE family subunit [Thermorudis peleae]|uniref:twin-arginine translocase TatA/TatE family subunit n=1 Tax=Thermorudis peleae TaxID=1382356 RepID=UPI000571EF6B|nr:twin-arginine translocase TatA/TatE family subunit [Thermorudis peleae]